MAAIEITQAEYNKKFGSSQAAEPIEISQADYDAKFGKEVSRGKVRDTADQGNEAGIIDTALQVGSGIKNASGFSGRIKPEYRSELSEPDTNGGRVRQVTGEVGKGISDLVVSGVIGAQDTIADLINLIDSDNSIADGIRLANTDMSKKLYYPDDAASAVGQEAGGMAITAPIGSATQKLFTKPMKVAGEHVKNIFVPTKLGNRRGVEGVEKITDDVMKGRRHNKNPNIPGYAPPKDMDIADEVIKRASQDAPTVASSPLFSIAKIQGYLQRGLGANSPHSKELAAQAQKLIEAGFTPEQALGKVMEAWKKAGYVESAKPSGAAGAAAAALFGSGN